MPGPRSRPLPVTTVCNKVLSVINASRLRLTVVYTYKYIYIYIELSRVSGGYGKPRWICSRWVLCGRLPVNSWADSRHCSFTYPAMAAVDERAVMLQTRTSTGTSFTTTIPEDNANSYHAHQLVRVVWAAGPPAGTRAGTRTTTRLQTKLVPALVRVFPLRFPIIMRTRTTRTNSYELCGRRAPLPEFEPELVQRPSYRQNSYQHWCELFHYDSRG